MTIDRQKEATAQAIAPATRAHISGLDGARARFIGKVVLTVTLLISAVAYYLVEGPVMKVTGRYRHRWA